MRFLVLNYLALDLGSVSAIVGPGMGQVFGAQRRITS